MSHLCLPVTRAQIQPLPPALMEGDDPYWQGDKPEQHLRRNVGRNTCQPKILQSLAEGPWVRVVLLWLVAKANEEGGDGVGRSGILPRRRKSAEIEQNMSSS